MVIRTVGKNGPLILPFSNTFDMYGVASLKQFGVCVCTFVCV